MKLTAKTAARGSANVRIEGLNSVAKAPAIAITATAQRSGPASRRSSGARSGSQGRYGTAQSASSVSGAAASATRSTADAAAEGPALSAGARRRAAIRITASVERTTAAAVHKSRDAGGTNAR